MGRGRGKMFQDYYKRYYEDPLGDADERITYDSLRYYFQARGVPLLLGTSAKTSKIQYDLWINTDDIPMGETKHPTELGHQIIANRIYESLC